MMPTALLWIADVVPSAFLGRFSSYVTTFGFLGQFLSPIVFAPVARSLGVHGVFLAAGVVAVTGLVLSVGGVLLHRNLVRSRAD